MVTGFDPWAILFEFYDFFVIILMCQTWMSSIKNIALGAFDSLGMVMENGKNLKFEPELKW